jgi:hypothetical protein
MQPIKDAKRPASWNKEANSTIIIIFWPSTKVFLPLDTVGE